MSTTLEAIRDEQIALVEALTPTLHSSRRFRVSRDEIEFRDWAIANPGDCWRRFAIQDLWTYEVPEVSGGDEVFEPTNVEVVIAYPKDPALYGVDNLRDMRDMIRTDANLVADSIGMWGTGNMSDSTAVRESLDYEIGEAVVFAVATYRVYFYRAILGGTFVATQNSSEQSFRVTTSATSDTLAVSIPKAMKDASYYANAEVISTTYDGVDAKVLDAGRTTIAFIIQFSVSIPSGVPVDCHVRDR